MAEGAIWHGEAAALNEGPPLSDAQQPEEDASMGPHGLQGSMQDASSSKRTGIQFFFEPLVPRKEKPEDEQGVEVLEDWVEFVGDIIFVAFLYKIGNVLKHCGWLGIGFTLAYFWQMYRSGGGMTVYINVVKSNDFIKLMLCALNLLGMFVLTMNIHDGSEEGARECRLQFVYFKGTFYGYFLSRVSTGLMWLRVAVDIPRSRNMVMRYMVNVSTSVLIMALLTFQSAYDKPEEGTPGEGDTWIARHPERVAGVLMLVVIVEMWAELATFLGFGFGLKWLMVCGAGTRPPFLMFISHLVARRNMTVCMCLGEGILALVTEPHSKLASMESQAYVILSFFILFGLSLLHFNCQPHEIEHSVVRQDAVWSVRSSLMYWLLYYPLFLVGVGLKIQLYKLTSSVQGRRLGAHEDWTELNTVGLMAVAMTLSQLLLLGIEVAQRRDDMWGTPKARLKLGASALCGACQCGFYLFALATGRDSDLIFTDCGIHVLLLVPGILMDLNVRHHSNASMCELAEKSPEAIDAVAKNAPKAELTQNGQL